MSTPVQADSSEDSPLLRRHVGHQYVSPYQAISSSLEDGGTSTLDPRATFGERFDAVPDEKRRLGVMSSVLLIFNRVIGTGIFASPSVILRSSGSVGLTFVMWILGSLVAAAGTAVYIEFGTALPRSGAEKTYLEFIFRRPKYLVTCMFAIYVPITGISAAAGLVFGEYAIEALDLAPTPFNIRAAAFACLTWCLIIHGAFINLGIRIQDALGIFKFVVIFLVAASGFLSLLRVPGFAVGPEFDPPRSLSSWHSFWEGGGVGPTAFVTGMFNVIWSYIGYSNANYALSETRDPVRTLKRAAPLAMFFVSAAYLSINIAYFAVVSKQDILGSGTVAAALFFRNLYGPATARILSAIIALSTLGNILSVFFTQGRLVQELGREGVAPFSSVFASNKPFGAPFAGIFVLYLSTIIVVLAAPPGDAYLFVINLASYPMVMFNMVLAGGLLLLYTAPFKAWDWNPPFKAYKLVVIFFFVSNIFLAIVPLLPPSRGFEVYQHLPYWSHVVISLAIGAVGILYWFVCFKWIPYRQGYRLEQETVIQDDGVSRTVLRKVRDDTAH